SSGRATPPGSSRTCQPSYGRFRFVRIAGSWLGTSRIGIPGQVPSTEPLAVPAPLLGTLAVCYAPSTCAAASTDSAVSPPERGFLPASPAAAAHLRAAIPPNGEGRRRRRRVDRHDPTAWRRGPDGIGSRRLHRGLRGKDGAQGRSSRRALEHTAAR